MRADQHEGVLNDTQAKREKDQMERHANEVRVADAEALTENPAFLRFIGRFLMPVLTQDMAVNNGSALAEFMGRRRVLLEMMRELEAVSPGFLSRMIAERETYVRSLLEAATKEQ